MRTFGPGEDLFHRPTNIPVRFVRAVGDVVTVEMFDPAGTGKRIKRAYPADEFETYDERSARLDEQAEENRAFRGKPKPAPKKPIYDV